MTPKFSIEQIGEMVGIPVASVRTPLGGTPRDLIFQTPMELRDGLPDSPPWLWENNFAEGQVTVVGGRPKAGKSTVIYEAVDRLVQGECAFLGAKLRGGSNHVVIVSEEHSMTALNKLRDTKRLHILPREHAFPKPTWTQMLAAAQTEIERVGARLFLIDSFTFWADMEAEAAQDAGAVQRRFNELVELAHTGVAIVLIHHQRKGAATHGDGLLGSTAFSANADIILEFERLDIPGAPRTLRRMMRESRWWAPPVSLLDWSIEMGYVLVRDVEDPQEADDVAWERVIIAALKVDEPTKRTELADLLGGDGRAWTRALENLEAQGVLLRTGAGGMKDPVTFTRLSDDVIASRPEI